MSPFTPLSRLSAWQRCLLALLLLWAGALNAHLAPREVVFIDTSVADWQVLRDGVQPEVEVMLLDAGKDGLAQMAEWARERSGYDAIHLFSHGSPGTVHLGAFGLNRETLGERAGELATLGAALNEDGDLLLYGCDVASGESGKSFIDSFAKLTSADIAASTNKTGASDKSGDWVLEYVNSQVQSSPLNTTYYDHLLSLVGTQVATTETGNPSTEYFSSATVGSGEEIFLDAAVDVNSSNWYLDIDPVNSRITMTMRNGTVTFNVGILAFDLVFSGGILDDITSITKNAGLSTSSLNIVASVTGSDKTISISGQAGGVGDGVIVWDYTSTSIGGDTTPPTFDVVPSAGSVTSSGFTPSASINEAGTIYYVVVADNDPEPSVAQVKLGNNSTNSAALASANTGALGGAPYSSSFPAVTGLSASTDYDVYFVATDTANNDQAAVTKVEVTTSAAAPTSPYLVDNTGDGNDGNYSAGQLTLREAASLAQAGETIQFANSIDGGTITLSTAITLAANVILDANTFMTLTITGSTISLAGNLTVINAGPLTIASVLVGTGNLTKTGAGRLTLSGTNTLSGALSVTGGTLAFGTNGNLSSTSGLTLDGGTLANTATGLTFGKGITLGSGGGTVDFSGGGNLTLSGVISGSGSLIITSTNGGINLILSGNNTHTGGTTLVGGILQFNHDNAAGTGILTINGGKVRASAARTINNDLVLGGTLTMAGSYAMTFTGDVDLGGANRTIDNSISSALTFSGVISNGSLTIGGSSNTGAVILSGNNTYTNTTITGSSNNGNKNTLSVTGDANLGTGTVTLNGTGAILEVTGSAVTIDNAVAVGSSGGTVSNANALTLSGAISGTGTLTKADAGTLTLSNTGNEAAWSGNIAVSAGTLAVGNDDGLSSGTLTVVGGTLELGNSVNLDNAVTLGAGGVLTPASGTTATLSGNLALTADATFNLGANTNLTISGVISGGFGLTKSGIASLHLTGSNTYTGATTVTQGTLSLTGFLYGGGAVSVNSGGTLGGTGGVNGTVTVASGGTLAPGVVGTNSGVGTLTLNSGLTIASGGTLAVDIAGSAAGTGYDQVTVTGSVTVTGATLSVNHSYTPGSGDTYQVIANDGSDAITGTFTSLSEGDALTAGGNGTVLTASYTGGGGNDFVLVAPDTTTTTTTTLTSSANPSIFGNSVTFTATVSESAATGTVNFKDDGTSITGCASQTLSGGSATCTTSALTVGSHPITAVYSGDSTYATSTGTLAGGQVVNCATNPVVTTTANDGAGSLRAAVAGACADSTITFNAGLTGQTIALDNTTPNSHMVIDKNLTIDGETRGITIQGSSISTGNSRVFYVNSGHTFTLKNLTVANATTAGNGGALYNDGGTVIIDQVTLSGNQASAYGGALYNDGGTLTLTETTMTGNQASSGAHGIYSTNGGVISLTDSTISDSNSVASATGGGIYIDAGGVTLTLTNTTVSGQTTSSGGGGHSPRGIGRRYHGHVDQ